MRKAKKKQNKYVNAYQLGSNSEMEKKMMQENKIHIREDGLYELFSTEAVKGSGELAQAGDYFKVDGNGFPYPNKKDWFKEHHEHVKDDLYLQKQNPVVIWEAGDGPCPEIECLVGSGRLVINAEDEKKYFSATLWGGELSAPKDAVIVFYSIERDDKGGIVGADFNFVARGEFERDYELC